MPYTLTFEVETTRRVRPVRIEGRAEGQLQGVGVWRLQPQDDGTRVAYRWTVRTTGGWMNLLAPLAQPLFRWNHDGVMRWGAAGLSRRLGVAVNEVVAPPDQG